MKDITNQKYGRLTVIRKAYQNRELRWRWECLCECGKTTLAYKNQLENAGKKECCDCAKKGVNMKHGGRSTRLYSIWQGMHARCKRETMRCFKDYGERGIIVCERWNDFESFRGDMGDIPPGKQIDRIDVNQGYSPENCRWVSATDNACNRRNSKRWFVDGAEFPSDAAAAKAFGVSTTTIRRWCEGGVDKRDGRVFEPKQNCWSKKLYE